MTPPSTNAEPRFRLDTDEYHGYAVLDSSNVQYVGWTKGDDPFNMVVVFKSGGVYAYSMVSRQRVVACARAKSVGGYINSVIKPGREVIKLA